MIDLVSDMNSIDGVCSDLASRTDRPQGYPFSRVTVYAVPRCEGWIRGAADYLSISAEEVRVLSAAKLDQMLALDFKKAGPFLKGKANEVKAMLGRGEYEKTAEGYLFGDVTLPAEFIKTRDTIPATDEPTRKTTGCGKYLIEVETEDCPDLWHVIQFRKAVKRYITEDIGLHIVPCVFGDKYPERNPPCIARVLVTLGNCPEALYQALEEHGEREFAELPIRLRIPTRKEICDGCTLSTEHQIDYGDGPVFFGLSWDAHKRALA